MRTNAQKNNKGLNCDIGSKQLRKYVLNKKAEEKVLTDTGTLFFKNNFKSHSDVKRRHSQ